MKDIEKSIVELNALRQSIAELASTSTRVTVPDDVADFANAANSAAQLMGMRIDALERAVLALLEHAKKG